MKNKALAAPYLVWMALFTIVPLAIVAYYAFTDAATGEFTFANIANLGNYMPILIKSIWLALISSLICIVIGYPVAYFIANCKETTQRFLYMLVMLPMYTVIMKIDRRLIEAAQDLGCNSVNVFKRVILPLSVPGIISGFTMVFVPAVSTFYISQKLGSSGTTLIGDVIESQFKTAYNPNLGAALSLILMVMIFICIGVMNRFGDEEEEVVTL